MALIERTTPGGNIYPDGASTFAMLPAYFRRLAENLDTRQTSLLNSAGSDATTKAGTAESNAKTYAQQQASKALEDAKAYADSASAVVAAPPTEALARWMDFGTGSQRIAIAGDSTWNDGGDPPRKLLLWLQGKVASSKYLRELQWNTTSNSYNAPVVVQAGTGTPDSGGTVLSDDFNRTAAELSGSTTSAGQVWAGPTGAWSADGSTASSTASTALMFDTKAKDHTATAALSLVTTATATQVQTRIYAGATTNNPPGGGNYIWAQINRTTSGTVQLSLWKRIGGVNTQLGSTATPASIVSNQATPQTMSVKVELAIQQVTATFTIGAEVTTITGTVTETEYGQLGQFTGLAQVNNTAREQKVDSFTATTAFVPGETSGVEILNAAVAGTSLDYQQARIATMYPSGTHIDTLVVTGGHNNGTTTPETFLAMVDGFVSDFRVAHPETRILIASQNPQKAPAATVEAHARRQAALRSYAMENGHEYLPVYEAFRNQSDGGDSLIQADGIHPTSSDPIISLNWSGTALVASVWMDAINGRRRIGTAAPITTVP